MRQTAAAAAAVVFALLIGGPALAADDVLGWQEFRWGMSEGQALKAAEASSLRVEPKDTTQSYAGGLYAPFESSITLHDNTFTVRFLFSRDTRGLSKIVLFSLELFPQSMLQWSKVVAQTPPNQLLEPVRAGILQTLTEKYGVPKPDQGDPNGLLEPDSVWTFPTTTIRLSGLIRMERVWRVNISYQPTTAPRKKGEKEKL